MKINGVVMMTNFLKRTKVFWLVIYLGFGNLFSQSDPALVAFLPEVPGWKMSEKPEIYIHDNLSDYIDGNCDLYFSYGFKKVVSGYYENEKNEDQAITVDIYDMGTKKGAFGVYSNMSNPEYSYGDIGCEAIVSPLQIQFWQDRFEVEIRGTDVEENAPVLQKFAQLTSQKLPDCQPIELISWLPSKNQIPHSFQYFQKDFLGQEYFPGGVEALYIIDNKEVKGFVVSAESVAQAKDYLSKYQAAQKIFKEVKMEPGKNSFQSYHQYTGHLWVGIKGKWFYGASSAEGADVCKILADAIAKNLK